MMMFEPIKKIEVKMLSDGRADVYSYINDMRAAVNVCGYRHEAVVHRAMNEADHFGLSGEDKFVYIAYLAISEMQRFRDIAMEQISLRAAPPIIIDGKLPS